MFATLFTRTPPLDEPSTTWLFEAFGWALRNFDAQVFYRETVLVVPDNAHFPGRADNSHDMAGLIFAQVCRYAGMGHWPFRLSDPALCQLLPPPRIRIEGALRGAKGVAPTRVDDGNALRVAYDPALVGNPEALIAFFAHTLAQHLGSTAREAPPGGEENWPHLTEVLAVFLGFGLMFANSAFNYRPRSCGSCAPAAERRNYLSQYDVTYALALFKVLKDIPDKAVTPHLKSSLRGFFRRSVRDVETRTGHLQALRDVH
jgi:hypothetical protein